MLGLIVLFDLLFVCAVSLRCISAGLCFLWVDCCCAPREHSPRMCDASTDNRAVYVQGISATALKKACRELGVERWPYCRKRQAEAEAGCAAGDDESRADTATGANSPVSSVSSSSHGSFSPARTSVGSRGDMAPPADLLDLLHRNAVLMLEAAKQPEAPQGAERRT